MKNLRTTYTHTYVDGLKEMELKKRTDAKRSSAIPDTNKTALEQRMENHILKQRFPQRPTRSGLPDDFQTKNPNLGKFWRVLEWTGLVYSMANRNILRSFGTFNGLLVI
jgi:hypothetical protein